MIVLDTNIVSEMMKVNPHENVIRWTEQEAFSALCITAITVQEIEFGLRLLPEGLNRERLRRGWNQTRESFKQTEFPFDGQAAEETAKLLAQTRRSGITMSLADAQIADICLSLGATLATRNAKDFAHVTGLQLCNPFE